MRRNLGIVVVCCFMVVAGCWGELSSVAALQPVATSEPEGTTIGDPRVDPAVTLIDAIQFASGSDPAAGPRADRLDLASGDFTTLAGGTLVADTYAQYSYVVPSSEPAGAWVVGFTFWDDERGTFHEVYVRYWQGGLKWAVGQSTNQDSQILDSGDLATDAFDLTPGDSNLLSLVVYDGYVILANNSQIVVRYDLADRGSGDVAADEGFLADDQTTTDTLTMDLSGFYVWNLDRTAGTASTPIVDTAAPTTLEDQLLTQVFEKERSAAMANNPLFSDFVYQLVQRTGGFDPIGPTGSIVDFYLTVTFLNPIDMSTPNDFGVDFRYLGPGAGNDFQFIVRSDGRWGFSIAGNPPLVTGSVDNVDPNPVGSNTIEIVAKGGTGILAINGLVVQQVDLSTNLNAGHIGVASGMYAEDQVDGRHVMYRNFEVYPLSV